MDSEDFKHRIQIISEQLKELNQLYPNKVEYSLIWTKYKEDGRYEFGNHQYCILSENNLDIYKDALIALKHTLKESKRFEPICNLSEFRVVCKNDEMSQDIRESLIRNGGDWIRRDETYVVEKKQKNMLVGGYTFHLRNLKGESLIAPFPFEGFHSSRFVLSDYTKLN